ncbi:GntR family transcriptional regulator [Verticiella sediminum]
MTNSNNPVANRSKPHYAVVADTLIRDIAKATYPVGSLLPPELELADTFGVSRNTMRSAMRVLVDMGLVSRRAGLGTVVQVRHATPNFVQTVESLDQLFPDLKSTELNVLGATEVVADTDLARVLACAPGESWLAIEGLRRVKRGRAAVSHSVVYVSPALKDLAKTLDKRRDPAFQQLEKASGRTVAEVVQQSDAAAMPAAIAKLLDVPAGSPALRTVRRYASEDGRILMVTDTHSAPGREGYTVRLRASWRGAETVET